MHAQPPMSLFPELEQIHELVAQLHGASRPSRGEVQEGLELGFARLISLEAELRRAEQDYVRRSGNADSTVRNQLKARIKVLRDALTELRELTEPEATSWSAAGFVLPARS